MIILLLILLFANSSFHQHLYHRLDHEDLPWIWLIGDHLSMMEEREHWMASVPETRRHPFWTGYPPIWRVLRLIVGSVHSILQKNMRRFRDQSSCCMVKSILKCCLDRIICWLWTIKQYEEVQNKTWKFTRAHSSSIQKHHYIWKQINRHEYIDAFWWNILVNCL